MFPEPFQSRLLFFKDRIKVDPLHADPVFKEQLRDTERSLMAGIVDRNRCVSQLLFQMEQRLIAEFLLFGKPCVKSRFRLLRIPQADIPQCFLQLMVLLPDLFIVNSRRQVQISAVHPL